MRLSNVLTASAVMVVASSSVFASTAGLGVGDTMRAFDREGATTADLGTTSGDLSVGDTIRFLDREGTTTGGELGVARTSAPNTELFRTFCVQLPEHLDFSEAGFNVVGISNVAVPGPELLANETAYLYSEFRNGTLTGYDYTPDSAARIADADALQLAIWHFQGQATLSAAALAANEFAQAAIAAGWTGIGNVRIANIVWATSRHGFAAGDDAQDVLVIIPLPPAAFGGLGLLGVVAIGQIRRRLGTSATV